jgi:hypothetical protein
MPDSEEKIAEQQETKKTPAVSVEIVKHQGNSEILTKRVRGEGGKFVKQKKSMPKSEDMTRAIRNLLAQPVAGPDGMMRKGDISRARMILDNIVDIAANNPNQPVLDKFGNPIFLTDDQGRKYPMTVFDAKAAMASVQAFKELWLRGYGTAPKSDEELEAQKTQRVQVVILQHPEMMDKIVIEDKPREALKPAFIDAEIIENK